MLLLICDGKAAGLEIRGFADEWRFLSGANRVPFLRIQGQKRLVAVHKKQPVHKSGDFCGACFPSFARSHTFRGSWVSGAKRLAFGGTTGLSQCAQKLSALPT
jgi:hypothetical protein